MIAASRMKPTVQPLVFSARRADRYSEALVICQSLLCLLLRAPVHPVDRTVAASPAAVITRFG
jgi:hypothetical protein